MLTKFVPQPNLVFELRRVFKMSMHALPEQSPIDTIASGSVFGPYLAGLLPSDRCGPGPARLRY